MYWRTKVLILKQAKSEAKSNPINFSFFHVLISKLIGFHKAQKIKHVENSIEHPRAPDHRYHIYLCLQNRDPKIFMLKIKYNMHLFSIYLSHCQVIKAIRAVKDNTLNSKSFSQIFGGLCFTCSCWTLWGTAEV